MREKIPQSPAFKEKLQISKFDKHPNNPNLFEFASQDFVVRKVPSLEYLYRSETVPTIEEAAQELKGLFDELKNSYGIYTPLKFVIAEDEVGKPSIFIFTEKVKKVDDGVFDYSGYLDIIVSLTNYLKDKYLNDTKFLFDLSYSIREQFVFGTVNDNPVPKWYLIDTDPDFVRLSKLDLEEGNMFIEFAESLVNEIEWLENECGQDLNVERKKLEDFIKTMESDWENRFGDMVN